MKPIAIIGSTLSLAIILAPAASAYSPDKTPGYQGMSYPSSAAASSTANSLGVGQQYQFTDELFTDIPENHTYAEAVYALRDNNVLRGYTDGSFRPNNRINRAEMARLLASPFILSTPVRNDCIRGYEGVSLFSDMNNTDWYANDVCTLRERSVLDGYPDGTFRGGTYINFAEAAKMVSQIYLLDANNDPNDEFWYEPYVRVLDRENAIPTTIRSMNQTVSRGEVAEMLYRLAYDRTDKPSVNSNQIAR